MRLEEIPILEIVEPINFQGGKFEKFEEEVIPREVILQDPFGRIARVYVYSANYFCGKIEYSYYIKDLLKTK
ncbi:MAG: hypothetical protein QXW97_00990 [Candidatus Pacearchaeota archaeon]